MDIIGDLYLLLNGKTLQGKKATYASYFVTLRYFVILLAKIKLEIVKNDNETKDIGHDCTRLNYYDLKKVADLLHLDFDRTRSARKIYAELKNSGLVKIERKGDIEYICLTPKGKEKCERKLEETRKLKEYFTSIPLLQTKYSAQNVPTGILLKGSHIKVDHNTEQYADTLINRISNWEQE